MLAADSADRQAARHSQNDSFTRVSNEQTLEQKMPIKEGTGVVFLIVRELRFEIFGGIGGDEHSELIGVMVAAEDGCQYCGKGVLLMEKVCDEGSSVRVDGSDEELLKRLLSHDPKPQPSLSEP